MPIITAEKSKPLPPGFKMPKKLGEFPDLMKELEQKRLALQREAEAYANAYNEMKAYLIDELPKSQSEGVAGQLYRAEIKVKIEPTITNFDALWAYARKTNNPDLFQRRLTPKAVQELWDKGKEVPGVEQFSNVTVSLTKR